MAGFGMVLGGALSGLGKGIVEEARQQREMMMKTLDEQATDRRLAEDRAFRASEGEKDRAATLADRADDRAFTMAENEKTRAASDTETLSAADGTVYRRVGEKLTPLTIDDETAAEPEVEDETVYKAGETAKVALTPPAKKTLKVADKDANVANRNRADLIAENYKTLKEDFNDDRSDAEKRQAAVEMADEWLGNSSTTKAAAPPPAPRDVAKRTVGKVYAAPDGRNVKWTGKGWEVVG